MSSVQERVDVVRKGDGEIKLKWLSGRQRAEVRPKPYSESALPDEVSFVIADSLRSQAGELISRNHPRERK